MATEIELKLSLPPHCAEALAQHPLLATAPVSHKQLFNTYYDTPALDLYQARVALRLRRIGAQWLRTVKSAEPSSSGGLSVRNEWEVPATPGEWAFDDVDLPGLRDCLIRAAPRLVPVFTTDFERSAWQLDYHGTRIELAFDRGHIDSGERSEPLCEVELELLSGEVDSLLACARVLQADLPLQPLSASKAQRGYALFRGQQA